MDATQTRLHLLTASDCLRNALDSLDALGELTPAAQKLAALLRLTLGARKVRRPAHKVGAVAIPPSIVAVTEEEEFSALDHIEIALEDLAAYEEREADADHRDLAWATADAGR